MKVRANPVEAKINLIADTLEEEGLLLQLWKKGLRVEAFDNPFHGETKLAIVVRERSCTSGYRRGYEQR